MRSFHWFVIAGLALLAVAPGAARAGGPRGLSITPRAPVASDAILISFRSPSHAPDTTRYAASVTTTRSGACRSFGLAPFPGSLGAGTRASIQVGIDAAASPASSRWCSGRAVARVLRRTAGGGWAPIPGARRRFVIARSPGARVLFGTHVLTTVLPTSTATVTAPGRADRVLGLGGDFDGFIPGKFILNTDYKITLGTAFGSPLVGGNAVVVSALVTDPLCAAPVVHTRAPLPGDASSSLTFLRSGAVSGTLVLAADPTTLAGCAGADTGTMTIALSGTLAEKKLADLTVTGSLTGVPAGGGVTASVAIELHLNVKILDT